MVAELVLLYIPGLGIAPELFYPVDVVPLALGEALSVVNAEVLEAVEHQPVVGAEAVGVDDALRHHLCLDDLA